MPNPENLIKNPHKWNSEEAAAYGKKGGIASGKARREKRKMADLINSLMSMPLKGGKAKDVDKVKSIADLKGQNIDVQTAIIVAQVQRALKGDVVSATFLRDTMGEKPVDNVQTNETSMMALDKLDNILNSMEQQAQIESEDKEDGNAPTVQETE